MKTRIALAHINNGFQYYLPYSVGLLQAYAQRHAQDPGQLAFLPLVYARRSLEENAKAMEAVDIVGFSAYMWNIRYSLALAKELKEQNPEVLILFGGPQVPQDSEPFLRANPWVDLCCHGEGEAVFLAILENREGPNWEQVPGISYLTPDGNYIQYPRPPRIRNLDQIPSPYLAGIFDPLMEPSFPWLAAWETNRGCPFSCTFCDWGSATQSKVYSFDLDRVCREIDWLAERQIRFMVCCDANFGILKRDLEIARYLAEVKRKTGFPGEVVVQNTKNATERSFQVHQILYEASAITRVTLSLQSLDDRVLQSVKRQNISTDFFRELQRRFNQAGIETYTDVIVGLPGETYDSFANGVSEMIANGQHDMIWFYNLYILPNAEVADPVYQQVYGLETVRTPGIYRNTSVVDGSPGTDEIHEVVIGTSAMPREDWVKSRVFAWIAAFLHFGVKPLQAAFVLLAEHNGISYRELIEAFTQNIPPRFILLTYIREFFNQKARELQAGAPEFCRRADQRGIVRWLSPEDDILFHLYLSNQFEAFFQEAQERLVQWLKQKKGSDGSGSIQEAIVIGKAKVMSYFRPEAARVMWF